MTTQSPEKEKRTLLVCLDPPKNQIHLGSLKVSILLIILAVVLILPFFPPSKDSGDLIVFFTNSEQSQYIPYGSEVIDFITTNDKGYALLSVKEGLDRSSSLELIKTDQTGDLQWLRTYGGFEKGEKLSQTKDGGYAIAGSYNGIKSTDDSLSFTGYSEFWVIKTDNNGLVQWQKTYYRDDMREIRLFSLIPTTDGGLMIGGYTDSWETWSYWWVDRDITRTTFLLKLSSDGIIEWEKCISKGRNNILIQTNDGGFVYAFQEGSSVWVKKFNMNATLEWSEDHLIGYNFNLLNLEQTSDNRFRLSISSEIECFIVLTINSNGLFQWKRSYDLYSLLGLDKISNSFRKVFMSTDSDFLLMISSYIEDGSIEDDGHVNGDWKNFLFRITTGGRVIWKRNIGEKEVLDIIQNSEGDYVIVGSEGSTFVMRVDQSGKMVDESWYYGPNNDDWISQVISTSDGGFTLLGYTSSIGNGKIDVIVLKSDKNGKIEWNTTIGGVGDDCVTSIIQINDGDFVLTGITDPFINFGYGHGRYSSCEEPQFNNNSIAWLTQINNKGKVLWNKTYSEISWIESILQTDDEGFVFIGLTHNASLFIEKTDNTGTIEWVKTYPLAQINLDHFGSMKCSCGIQTTDDSYLVGISTTVPPFEGLYILKFDAIGDLLWRSKYISMGCDGLFRAMFGVDEIIENEDDCIIVGRYHRNDGCCPLCYGPDFPFLLKIDQDGSPVWNITYESNRVDGRCHNSLADLILGSKISGIGTQDQGYLLGRDNWLFKTNQKGEMEWNQTYNGQIFSTCQINDGGIILAGYETVHHINGGSSREIWVGKTDDSGEVLWEKTVTIQANHSPILQFVNETSQEASRATFFPSLYNLFFLPIIVYLQPKKRKKILN